MNIVKSLLEDIDTILHKDPAANSRWEVLLCYPGVWAVIWHRPAHWLYLHGHKTLARWISQKVRLKTGIEIHPGASIGKRCFIDHGMGVVIGETAVVGDDCTLYQGVTLGGTGKETGKRHPTLGNNVMVSSGAKVLGPFRVGDNVKIGAGAVVLNEIPSECTVVGVPGRIVKRNNVLLDDMDQISLPDPDKEEISELKDKILKLEKQVAVMKELNDKMIFRVQRNGNSELKSEFRLPSASNH